MLMSTPAALMLRLAQSSLKPTVGKAITVGGNHQIPTKGTGGMKMKIKDTKGEGASHLRQAVGNDYKINFPNAKKCVMFFAHCVKFEAKTGGGRLRYQFQSKSTDSDQGAHVATSGTSNNVLLWHK
ncbi:LOW QUALITY PROTEIN: Hypothetical protein PHPALM_66 [Phytophthora palmivora]|uniref:Uncharacterized protein n=1 Tax=Phytophthora palmivora TaxID=4796 RepID=A0A2P4YVT5_9STRA|nr:LOW QUALITY PROTEIN: Hypothetical protein PHPALM_66 [Phytophthora palmivora]